MIREIPETLNNKDGSVDRGHDCWANASERPRQCAETQLLVREKPANKKQCIMDLSAEKFAPMSALKSEISEFCAFLSNVHCRGLFLIIPNFLELFLNYFKT